MLGRSYLCCSYAQWMLNTGMTLHRVYVDETGLNLYLSRSRGRSPVGERASRIVCGQRGRNLTVIMVISDKVGVLYYETAWGRVDAERFRLFLEHLAVILGEENAVVIMDNVPCHRQAEALVTHQVKKLAPNSPFLNPIENCFAVYKADLKQRLGQVQELLDDRDAALQAGHRSIKAWREALLEDLAGQAVPAVSPEKVAAAYQHANSFIGACLAKEDIWAE